MKKNLIKLLVFMGVFGALFAFLFLFNTTLVFAEEVESETTTEATNTLIEWIKNLSMDDIRAWLIAICSKLGIDTMLIVSTVIYVVRTKAKEARDSKFYKDLMAKMDEEYRKHIEDLMNQMDQKLESVNENVVGTIKKQNAEKREEAKATVDQAKAALSEIKISLDE